MRTAMKAALLALPLCLPGYAQDTSNRQPSQALPAPTVSSAQLTNESFLKEAALSGMAEIELSRLALTRSQDPQIQNFAQRMVNDHTATANELKTLAARQRVSVPAVLGKEQQSKLDQLKNLSGPAFDKAYTQHMQQDHDKAVALFTSAANSSALDNSLQQFANKTLPTLRDHQNNAHGLKTLTHDVSGH